MKEFLGILWKCFKIGTMCGLRGRSDLAFMAGFAAGYRRKLERKSKV